MPLADALRTLESVADEAGEPSAGFSGLQQHAAALGPPALSRPIAPNPAAPPPPVVATDAAGAGAGAEEPRVCMICLDELRSVRFGCGHACCCEGCVAGVRATAAQKAREAADPSLPQVVRNRAAAESTPRCPTCREPIGGEYAETGAQVASAPTFVMQARGQP